MKGFSFIIFILFVQHLNADSHNYCENERNYLCKNMKHVGCAESDVSKN